MTIRIMIPESKKKVEIQNIIARTRRLKSSMFLHSIGWLSTRSFLLCFFFFFCLNYAFHPFPVVVRLQLE